MSFGERRDDLTCSPSVSRPIPSAGESRQPDAGVWARGRFRSSEYDAEWM
jgi:hypothetical protein